MSLCVQYYFNSNFYNRLEIKKNEIVCNNIGEIFTKITQMKIEIFRLMKNLEERVGEKFKFIFDEPWNNSVIFVVRMIIQNILKEAVESMLNKEQEINVKREKIVTRERGLRNYVRVLKTGL